MLQAGECVHKSVNNSTYPYIIDSIFIWLDYPAWTHGVFYITLLSGGLRPILGFIKYY
jgi:hypothetical protein